MQERRHNIAKLPKDISSQPVYLIKYHGSSLVFWARWPKLGTGLQNLLDGSVTRTRLQIMSLRLLVVRECWVKNDICH